MVDARAASAVWRSVRNLPEFFRLVQVRLASQFGEGLFQAGLAGALLFSPERAVTPWGIAGAFAVLFLPYSLLGPFAGALLDRWDRRWVLVGANLGRLVLIVAVGVMLAAGAGDLAVLCAALVVNGFSRFVASGLSAALPHVVPREQVITMNAVATAAGGAAALAGALFMFLPRVLFGANSAGSAVVILLVVVPVALALFLALRFSPHVLGPDDTARSIHGSVFYAVASGWLHGARTVATSPTVAATLSGLAAHRMALGINTLLVFLLVRQSATPAMEVAAPGKVALFGIATGAGSFLATIATPAAVRRWGRAASANGALGCAALIQLCGAGLQLPVMVVCGFFLGAAGQVVKLCADSAMQIDVDDALRGHVFAVQDALYWVSFVGAVAAAATVVPTDGQAPMLVVAGSAIYFGGLAVHALLARRGSDPS